MKKPDPIEMLETVESVKKEADELMMKKIDHYEKELALVREDAQIQILTLEKRISELLKINESHQKLNGKLQERLTEVEHDNKYLSEKIERYRDMLRKAGL